MVANANKQANIFNNQNHENKVSACLFSGKLREKRKIETFHGLSAEEKLAAA